jgi:hypothetical protein
MILLLLTVALAGPIEDGAAAWDQGDLDAAIAAWSAPLAEGRGSPVLHGNLGVAWYRKGDLPRAIAHWRMARVLGPRDGDAAHNLAVVRAEVEGAPPPAGGLPTALQLATVGEYGVLGTLGLLVGAIGAWIARVRRRTVAPWLAVGAIGALLGAASWWGLHHLTTTPGAVVLAGPLALRVDPHPAAPTDRRLVAGAEVAVERRTGDFVLVRASDGARGWAPVGSVAIVGPTLELPPP